MSNSNQTPGDLDQVDQLLLDRLSRDGRASWVDLATDTGLTAPGVAQRVRRLMERRVILGFAALLASDAVAPICAFAGVTLDGTQHDAAFRQAVHDIDEVQECHRLAGDGDYLLKLRCRSLEHLDEVLTRRLPSIEGLRRTTCAMVLTSVKEQPLRP